MGFDVDHFPGTLTYAKLSQILADAGFVMQTYEQDVGGLGTSTRRQPMVGAMRHQMVGVTSKLFDYQFAAAVQNTALWKCNAQTMTATQGSGTVLFNASSTLTTTTGVSLHTWRTINLTGNGTVRLEIEGQFTATPLANQVIYMGFHPSATGVPAAPTDGVYFKYTSAGLVGIVNFGGVETATAVLRTTGQITSNQSYTFGIDVSNSGVDFWLDETLLATLPPAAANGTPMQFDALPISLQFFNAGTVSGSPVMQWKVSSVVAWQKTLEATKSWETQQALTGLMASQGAEGMTIGTTALLSNNLAAGTGFALTNTTAAAGSGLGGQFSVQPTLAAGTDGVLQSFQVPAATAAIPGRSLVIRGLRIQGLVTTAFTGGPVLYAYSLAYGSTGVSLGTAESTSFTNGEAKAPRRLPLGFETYVVTAPVGTLGQGVQISFAAPIVVNPAEFVQVIAKNLGTVTSAGVITFLVYYDAYWE